jgi:hypothetical protein
MRYGGRLEWIATGLVLGAIGAAFVLGQQRVVLAANDRYEDYIICTGAVADRRGSPTDGVWMLDYRAGKLLGTVIDRFNQRIIGWAEVDLVQEFGIQPRQKVHFLMTTGNVAVGQAALYLAETSTGKLGVYTMQARPDGLGGMVIRRNDMVMFRKSPPDGNQ